MSIITPEFIIFILLTLITFYTVPARIQSFVILAASLIFAASFNWKGLIWIFLSSFSIWAAAKQISVLKRKQKSEPGAAGKARLILFSAITLNLSFLIILKYVGFFLDLWTALGNPFTALIPIGLSYYTLDAISYLMDVYWGRTEAESSYAKILLFLGYFPKMLQGPLCRYQSLSQELAKVHTFHAHNLKYGVQRMLWGYFKLSVVYTVAQTSVSDIFWGYKTPYGLTVLLGFILFGFQLYANFSGGIDVLCGVSECLGISMPENFTQPFHAKSLGDFWRRWHITLGSWMKDYIFYPFSMSKPVGKVKKSLKKRLPRRLVNRITIAVADIVVFLIVGVWHGTGTNYVLWGLYNGLILAFSEVMADVYVRGKQLCHISADSRGWGWFCTVRTFLIVTLGWATDCAFSGGEVLHLVNSLLDLGATNLNILQWSGFHWCKLLLSIGLVLLVDSLHERKISIRSTMEKQNIWIQLLFWALFIQLILLFDFIPAEGGLMYAVF